MNVVLKFIVTIVALTVALNVFATAADLEVNTPGVNAIKQSMQARHALYAKIVNTNGHPEWQAETRSTFAQRWIQHAQPGWWVQSGGG